MLYNVGLIKILLYLTLNRLVDVDEEERGETGCSARIRTQMTTWYPSWSMRAHCQRRWYHAEVGEKAGRPPSGRSNDALAMLSANKQVHHLPSHIANPVPALFSSLPSPTILFAYGTFLPMLAGDNAAADLISLRILLVSARDLLRLT